MSIENNQIFTKVFMWMFIGLLVTFGTGYYISLNSNMFYNVFAKYYLILAIIEIGVAIFLSVRIRKMSSMTAKILYLLYTFLTGLTFSAIFVVYEITSIIYVFGVSALIFGIFAAIGYFTKIDLSRIGVYLMMILIGIIICSIINIFVKSEAFNLGLVIAALIIFIIYVAYDIQVIKKNMYGIPDEENLAIYGAFQLYLDFINIFIRLLELFGNRK